MSSNVMQAFDFTPQAYIKSGLVANDFIFQAFIYYLHFPVGNNADDLTVKRQLLERLIACWQDQKYSFVLLEKLFIQVLIWRQILFFPTIFFKLFSITEF